MKCPNDGTPLVHETYENEVMIDKCPDCNGVWLNHGELKKIQENLSNDYSEQLSKISAVAQAYEFAKQKAKPARKCPVCSVEMFQEEYAYCSQILIERCPECLGVWLDAGELQALEMFFEQQAEVGAGARLGFWASLFR